MTEFSNFFSKISGYLQDFSLEKYEGFVNDPLQIVVEGKYVVSFTKEPPRNSEKIFIFLKLIFPEAYIKGISICKTDLANSIMYGKRSFCPTYDKNKGSTDFAIFSYFFDNVVAEDAKIILMKELGFDPDACADDLSKIVIEAFIDSVEKDKNNSSRKKSDSKGSSSDISSIPILPMCVQFTSKFHELVSKNNQPRISLKKIATTWEEQCSTRILFIKGSHGTGKSHFVASLQHESPFSSYAFLDYTYCSMVKNELIGIMAKHIAYQLSEINKNYKKNLERFVGINKDALNSSNTDINFFLRLVCEPMKGISEPFILLIDAIDEASDYEKLNDFIILIIKTCPNIRLIITSTEDINFGGLSYEEVILENNKNDVEEFIKVKAGAVGYKPGEIEALINCADGNYKFAEFAIDNKITNYTDFSEKTDFDCLYRCYFERIGLEDSNKMSSDLKMIFALIILQMNSIRNIIEICGENEWKEFYSLFHGFVVIHDGYVHLWHFSVDSYVRSILSNNDVEEAKNKCEEFLLNVIDNINKVTLKNSSAIIDSYEFLQRIDRTAKIGKDLNCLYKIQCSAYKMSKISLSLKIRECIERKWRAGTIRTNSSYDIYICSSITLFETYYENGEVEKAHDILQSLSAELDYDKLTPLTKLYVKLNYCWDNPSRDKLRILEKELENACEYVSDVDYNYYQAFCRYLSGKLYYSEGDYQKCIDNCNKAMEIAKETWVEDVESFCSLLINQKGWSQFHLKNYDEALELFKESHNIRLKFYGEYSRYTTLAKDALVRAMIKIAENENKKIECETFDLAKKALDTNIVLFGETSPRTARSFITQALLFNSNSDFNSAVDCLKKAKDIYEANSAEYATCCQLLGDTLLKDEDCTEEELREAHALYTDCYNVRKELRSKYISETETALLIVEEKLNQIDK